MESQLCLFRTTWRHDKEEIILESKKKWRGEKVMVEWRVLHTTITHNQETRVSILLSLSNTSYFLNKISAYT